MWVECAHFLLLQPIRTAGSHHIPLGFRSHHECVREVETLGCVWDWYSFECCECVSVCVCELSVIEFCGPVVKRLVILLCLFYRKAILNHFILIGRVLCFTSCYMERFC